MKSHKELINGSVPNVKWALFRAQRPQIVVAQKNITDSIPYRNLKPSSLAQAIKFVTCIRETSHSKPYKKISD
jgi:hypothetical protein